MSALEKLLPLLSEIDTEDLVYPDIPIAVALQEANDLATYLSNKDNARILAGLLAVGLPGSELPALKRGIEAAREAQSGWVVVRDRKKSQAQQEREAAGTQLRSDLVDAIRWNLRHDRVAQATLDAIQQGDGVEDLIQDLDDLAALAERHHDKFDKDETFDVDAKVEEARSSASAIRAGVSQARSANKPNDAKLLRDRAFTYLDERVSTIREAGRYAFRKEPAVRMRFSSAYERTKRRRTKPIPAEPEAPAPADAPTIPIEA